MAPSPGGGFPLHDLVMRMVEDDLNGVTHKLKPLVHANARKGVNRVLDDLRRADLIAGGGKLFVLIDRDRVAEHLGLPKAADEAVVRDSIAALAAPTVVGTFFLRPNLEGLLRAIQACEPALLPEDLSKAIQWKKLNARDNVFNEARKAAHRPLRECVRRTMPDVDDLARAIAAGIPAAAIGP